MTPQPALLSEFMAVGNVFYGASELREDTWIHMIDQEGQVTESFVPTQEGSLEAMVASGDSLYISTRDLGSSAIEKWTDGETAGVVATMEQGQLSNMLDLALWEDELYAIGMMADGVSVGVYQMVDGSFVLSQMHNMQNVDVKDAIFANGQMLVLATDGSIYYVNQDGNRQVEDSSAVSDVLIHGGSDIYAYDVNSNSRTIYGATDGVEETTLVDTDYTVSQIVGSETLWAVAVDDLGYVNLLSVDKAGQVEEFLAITGTLDWYLVQGRSMIWYCLGAVVISLLSIMLSHFILKKSKRMVLKVVCITVWYVCFVGFGIYAVDSLGMEYIAKNTWFISIVALFSLIYIILVYNMISPLRKMMVFAEQILAGNYVQYPDALRDDEVGSIGRSLNGVSALLGQTEYRNRKAMRVYHRFVPKDIQNILGKNSVLELESGQATTLSTVIGVVSVSNRHEIREHAKDETYTGWMMHALNTISGVAKNHNAVPTGTSCSLQGVNLLYHEHANNAMTYGMELFSRQRGNGTYAHMPTNYTFVVHHGDAIYGMGGDADQAFMFLVSQELEILGNYQDRLGSAGVRMVMTEQALKQMTCPMETRYLGFVGEGAFRFKMYEILNVLGEKERQLKLQTGDEFAKGLKLFYQNDYYLARNQFSSIVKKNPIDGISRWYVFACERAFQSERENSSCGLFADDLELDTSLEKPISYV